MWSSIIRISIIHRPSPEDPTLEDPPLTLPVREGVVTKRKEGKKRRERDKRTKIVKVKKININNK